MKDLQAWLLRCKEDLSRRDFDRLLEDFHEIQSLSPERLSPEEAREALRLLEELLREAENLAKDYRKGLAGLSDLRKSLPGFFEQLRYLLLRFSKTPS